MRSFEHRMFVLVSLLFITVTTALGGSVFPGDSWRMYRTPEEAGWSSEKLDEARREFEDIGSAAAMVVYRGAVVAAWGDIERRYMCHSARKSLLSALIGLHVDSGNIDLQKTLAQLGIDDIEPKLTEQEKKARVIDLLRARSGVYRLAAYEPAENPKPERGSHPPGSKWCYNNWDFNTLLTIFEQESGTKAFEEFNRRFAAPLQMQDFRVRDGYYHVEPEKSMHPAYPFRMSARDLARFGLLFLNNGKWNGKRILSEKWVADSTRSYSDEAWFGGYGYMWWIEGKEPFASYGMYSALGLGEQSIDILPGLDMVFVHRTDTYAGKRVKRDQRLSLLAKIIDARTGEAVEKPALVPLREKKATQEFKVSPQELRQFTGKYIVAGFGIVEVELDGERLTLHHPHFGTFGLIPRSETGFVVEDLEQEVAFWGEPRQLVTESFILGTADQLLEQGNTTGAIEMLRRCVSLFPGNGDAREKLRKLESEPVGTDRHPRTYM